MRVILISALASLLLISLAAVVRADGASGTDGAGAGTSDAEVMRGKRLFAQCGACHTTAEGAASAVGPNLHGLFGRKAGSVPGFAYSEAMQKSGIVWDEASLDSYITLPAAFVAGNKMVFPGVPKPADRAVIIAYLREATR